MIFLSLTMYFQSAFFGQFYTHRKVKRLENNVIKYNLLYTNGFISSISFDISMLQFEENNNAKIVILDSTGAITRTPVKIDASKMNVFNKLLNEWSNSPDEWAKIIASKKTITTDYYNEDFNVNNVICISPVVVNNTTTEVILVVSSLQPIEEASAIIKEFYVYIFWGAAVLIIILSFIYSNMISKPLIVLNRTASKMVEMDFSTF